MPQALTMATMRRIEEAFKLELVRRTNAGEEVTLDSAMELWRDMLAPYDGSFADGLAERYSREWAQNLVEIGLMIMDGSWVTYVSNELYKRDEERSANVR